MSIAGIEKVREAETKAAQIKKSSEEAAAQIIADGKKESKVLLEDAEKKAPKLTRLQLHSPKLRQRSHIKRR